MAGLPVMLSSYRYIQKLSMRISVPVLIIALASVAIASSPPAGGPKPPDPGAALPAGELKDALSLYLREAASGPVRWQRWGEPAFKLARTLQRPLLLDIGAVWCHWCHVMDQATYADARVAALINSKFVPIKVDADERPDIDGYYQDAAGGFGAGGWPLTCFTTPDGAPLFIAGYMPPEVPRKNPHGFGMLYILDRIATVYATDPSLQKMARDTAAKIAEEALPKPAKHTGAMGLADEILHSLKATYDAETGGFGIGPGPRFYDFSTVQLALAYGFFGHPEFTAMGLETLKKIAAGGVYDQLDGGFHRYSTDPTWSVPHFEKMTYDQAAAIEAYAEAYEASGDPRFQQVAMGTIGYVNSTLLDAKTHTFYSHQDADAFPGDDGSYYTWTRGEIEHALEPKEARAALLYFGFEDDPARAPDGRVVLRRALDPDQVAARLKLSRSEAETLLARAFERMTAVRERRRHPKVDQSLLVDRNASMDAAYLTAAAAFGDPTLKRIVLDDIDYIAAHARSPDGSFYHSYSASGADVTGLVADQVYMMGAMVAAYQASGEARYLNEARTQADLVMKHFRDPASGLLRNREPADKDTVLASVKGSIDVLFDRPMPSVQAVAAMALRALAVLASNARYDRDAAQLLAAASRRANAGAGTMLAETALAIEQRAGAEAIVAVVGDDKMRVRELWDAALRTYRPGKIVVVLDSRAAHDGALPEPARQMFASAARLKVPLAFVCAGTACANPVSDPAALAKLIREFGVSAPRRLARDGGF